MKKRLAIIGAIEGTEDRFLEKDYLFLINTFYKNNKNTDIDIHLVQPTDNDILPETEKELKLLGVKFTKEISEYNQSHRDFNYTNMPIACNYFYEKISNDYEYFLWVDGDVFFNSKINLPDVKDGELMFLYNNQFFNVNENRYVTINSDNYNYDHECYEDLISKINLNSGEFEATNSWIIYGKSDNNIWKEWNDLTRKYLERIKIIGKENFKFYEKSKNFENRVEELTLDIAVKNNNVKQILPTGCHTFNSKDSDCVEYVEKYNKNNFIVHYDSSVCIQSNKELLKYVSKNIHKNYLKTLFIKIYGFNHYKEIFI